MRRALRILALGLVLAAFGIWLGTGAHRGWTQTSVQERSVDPVTGLEAVRYEPRFVPGLDALGGALAGASLLAGASFLFRKPPQP
jgi:TRAP-type C4-dicarboxylate transport system permease small subunit